MNQESRTLIAVFISMMIIIGWQEWYVKPLVANQDPAVITDNTSVQAAPHTLRQPIVESAADVVEAGKNKGERVTFNNAEILGSINLVGARVDDLVLRNYRERVQYSSDNITLLAPSHTNHSYFAEFGWISPDKTVIVPNSKTLWTADKSNIEANEMVKLHWVNPQGVRFEIHLTMTNDFMFLVEQAVHNNSGKPIELKQYALLNRIDDFQKDSSMVVHEGGIGVFEGKLQEIAFEDMKNTPTYHTNSGWLGFSDKYWLTALIPHNDFDAGYSAFNVHGAPRLQADMSSASVTIETGNNNSQAMFFFAGAKKLDLLDFYRNRFNIPLFDRAVDFGVLYFITKPLLELLHSIYGYVGNFGIAILILTILIKILLFPLAYKGYKGMNKMKALQPHMTELREKHKDDASAMQTAMMELYRKEQVNPLSGCLPILLQAPVFFALYKVLYVSIEMRHAPFFGWIHDLSAPDPTTIFNLFGLIPWAPPALLMVGVFPLLMASTMYIQQRMSPEPPDPAQAQVMRLLPLVFLFMFAAFPVGLVVYWSWSNVISITQQLLIKQMMGENKRTRHHLAKEAATHNPKKKK
ncbi:MAG: membrane protein insertase YidC [Proteobacteria bacterium]|nr:membrane protein insertase YidC [Pseudomonadota bacterium]